MALVSLWPVENLERGNNDNAAHDIRAKADPSALD